MVQILNKIKKIKNVQKHNKDKKDYANYTYIIGLFKYHNEGYNPM